MAEQYSQSAVQLLPAACVVDITPPTFLGIKSLIAQKDGSLLAEWDTASDPTGPLRYRIYIKKDDSSGLFNPANVVFEARTLGAYLFYDVNLLPMEAGHAYYVGVRAVDGVNNEDSNVAILSAVSSGVLDTTLAEFINVVKAVMANGTCNITSEVESIELQSKIETNEVASVVCAEHTDSDVDC